tara:strand:+ start:638 stop:856 length:219 start_codon:yes stop_codon:yes gene_type:complete
MKKMETKKPPAEYKFEYCLGDNQNHGEKFYLANTLNEAVKDFEHTCRKRSLHPHHLQISRWDRWRGVWDRLN